MVSWYLQAEIHKGPLDHLLLISCVYQAYDLQVERLLGLNLGWITACLQQNILINMGLNFVLILPIFCEDKNQEKEHRSILNSLAPCQKIAELFFCVSCLWKIIFSGLSWSVCEAPATSLLCKRSSFKGQVVSGQASVAITTSSFSPEVWVFVKGSRVRLLA